MSDSATQKTQRPHFDPSGPSGTAPEAFARGELFDRVNEALRHFVAELVKADGGELYLIRATASDVHLHLAGTCAGCPGVSMTRERLLAPAVHAAVPEASLVVTTGWSVPDGGKRVA